MNPYERIAREIASDRGVDPVPVLAGDKRHCFMEVRHAAFWRLRERNRSFPQIGEWSGFHHTTVMNGVARHAALQENRA